MLIVKTLLQSLLLIVGFCLTKLPTASSSTPQYSKNHGNNLTIIHDSILEDQELDYPSISQELYEYLSTTAEMAKIAYCTVNPFFSVGELKDECEPMRFCRETENTRIVGVFRPNWWSGSISGTVAVVVKEDTKEVFVNYRGTCAPGDWVTDFNALQSKYMPVMARGDGTGVSKAMRDVVNEYNGFVGLHAGNGTEVETARFGKLLADKVSEKLEALGQGDICAKCKVHMGVYLAHAHIFPKVFQGVKPFVEQGYKLTVTGHSLGGGFAQLAGAEFQYLGYMPRTVSYGQLRVGNPETNEWTDMLFHTRQLANKLKGQHVPPYGSFTRVYQTTDLVPLLPPFKKYTHAGMAIAIEQITLPQDKGVVEFRGASNNWKNEGIELDDYRGDWRALFVLYQHLNYFTRLSWPCNDAELFAPEDAWVW